MSAEPIYSSAPDFTDREVNRGKMVLNSPLLSDEGKRFVIRSIDPYHDTLVRPGGFPDFDQSATVVQEINMTWNLTQPASATGLWDAHIFNWCEFGSDYRDSSRAVTYNINTGAISAGSGFSGYTSGLQMLSGPTNARMLPTSGGATIDDVRANSLNPYTNVTGMARIVGMAFEVVNTTAEIYKQGTITAYRQPQSYGHMYVNYPNKDSAGNTVYNFTPVKTRILPPANVTEAMIIPQTKQWPAERGYYGVITLSDVENPLRPVSNEQILYVERGASTSNGVMGAVLTNFSLDASTSAWSSYRHFSAPLNTTGVYLTGLSPETTLQVNVKFLIESAPDARNPLSTLAEPSAPYDPEALRLYAQLAHRLPVGVPFDENPDGEWFRTVLGTLGEAATMASAINPLFGLVGKGLQAASHAVPAVMNYFDSNRKRKQPMKVEPSKLDKTKNQSKANAAKAKLVKQVRALTKQK